MRSKNWKNTIILFFFFMIYKLGLEFGYWYVLRMYFLNTAEYVFDFNIKKYLLGFFMVIVLFFFIEHDNGKVSTFFLDMHYALAIIPMTVIYAFGNKETIYYIGICISYLLAVLLMYVKKDITFSGSQLLSTIMLCGFIIITVIVYLGIILENDIPSLRVLNIFNVYEFRANFQINKYIGYLYRWQITVINPLMIIRGIQRKCKSEIAVFTSLQVIAYLYTTQKTILFIIPLIYIVYVFGRKPYFSLVAYGGFSVGLTTFALLARVNYDLYKIFSLFGRRVLLLPANLKFLYYDYFTSHSTIGLSNTLWGSLLDLKSPYDKGIGNIIAEYYLGSPETNSNTGFLAEGYYMFGYLGIILAIMLFVLLLKCMDFCAKRNGFAFTVGVSIYSIFMLNDTSLIDSMIFGNITILLFVLVFYNSSRDIEGKRLEEKGAVNNLC